MDCLYKRLSNVILAYVICMGIAGLTNMSTVWFKKPSNTSKISGVWIYEFKKYHKLSADQVSFSFIMDFDFRSSFNWNTKQLYVYLTAHYTTKDWKDNHVIVYDVIISEPEDAQQNNARIFAILNHAGTSLEGTNVKLTLDYNYVPIIGPMTQHHACEHNFDILDGYKK